MFAYCLNNPTNRTDVTGSVSLWYYLIVDGDMGYVHRAVQDHIRTSYGVRTEVGLTTYGRADILVAGGVWEIKHAGVDPGRRIVEAYAQALSYVLLNEEVTHIGTAYAYSGYFYIGCLDSSYLIEYSTPVPGVVLYTITEVNNYDGSYAFVYVPIKSKSEEKQGSTFPVGLGGAALCGLVAGYGMPVSRDFSYCLEPLG